MRHLRVRPAANLHPTGFPQIDLVDDDRRVTLLGAACRASFAASWRDRAELEASKGPTRIFQPQMDEARRESLYGDWQRAVERSRDWAE